MMAELDTSFPKSGDGKQKKNISRREQELKFTNTEVGSCSRCQEMLPVYTCVDCGSINLCNDCDRIMHNGSGKNKKQHRITDLFSSHCKETKENGIAEGKLIDFDQCDEDDFAFAFEAKPTSFLLVDGSEKLQVRPCL